MSLDPRTRLALLLLGALALAFTRSPWLLGGAVVVLSAAGLVADQAGVLRRAMRFAVPLGALVFLVAAWGSGPGPALTVALRLFAMVAAGVLALGGTPSAHLGSALVAGGVPYPAAFVAMTALHFVPVISRRAHGVWDAQRARGIRLDAGVIGLRHVPALVLPVLFQSFKLADDLAEALECRGFARPGRTFRQGYRLAPVDWLVLVAAVVAVTLYVRAGGA